ncbi:AzlC family ABC transporter permease [Hahella ganghwensis]|uniref:AzlC family ABC transporter permease n=1 Tax=Hahella ganghwensis TaxID=286420 RepID=UPI0003650E42|nr:AzlC family ABC transporter permease [Hahella ganghwensis]
MSDTSTSDEQTFYSSYPDSDIRLVFQAVIDILPLALAVVPWGVLCGSLAIEAGLTPLQAQCMSLLVFAGAVQLASLSIIGAGGPLSSILTSSAVISSRHLLYSAVLREDIKPLSLAWRCLLAFFLTDEMFAITVAFKARYNIFSPLYSLAVGFMFYLVWNLATLAGILAGKLLPSLQEYGLEFAIAATFIAIVIPGVRSWSVLGAVLASGLTALICEWFKVSQGLIIATVVGMACGFLLSFREEKV